MLLNLTTKHNVHGNIYNNLPTTQGTQNNSNASYSFELAPLDLKRLRPGAITKNGHDLIAALRTGCGESNAWHDSWRESR